MDIRESKEVGGLWTALIGQFQSTNNRTLRKLYRELINIEMRTTESLIEYQGTVQQMITILEGTSYSVKKRIKNGVY